VIKYGERKVLPSYVISFNYNCLKVVEKKVEGLFSLEKKVELIKIPIVREYPNVFPSKLLRLPQNKEVEVSIDVISRIVSIA